MAYRCGWTVLKGEENQTRVLAIDLDRRRFEEVLAEARLSSHYTAGGGATKVNKCRDGAVVVQWDPERFMKTDASPLGRDCTSPRRDIRSIQIGLRGSAVEDFLLDPNAVRRIADVTDDFRRALEDLKRGDSNRAEEILLPGEERVEVLEVPDHIREVLGMNVKC
mmetsp:Transcript_16942/g.48957  ORF Transcript_16942/g.48957 Transcript_16942/m.48957 type:complete len:165 (+) Transcript_16942:351-845(+)